MYWTRPPIRPIELADGHRPESEAAAADTSVPTQPPTDAVQPADRARITLDPWPNHAHARDRTECSCNWLGARRQTDCSGQTAPARGRDGLSQADWGLTQSWHGSAGVAQPRSSPFFSGGLTQDPASLWMSHRPGRGRLSGSDDSDSTGPLSRRQYLFLAAGMSGAGATAGGAASGVIGDSSTAVDQAVIIRDLETYASGGGISVVDESNTSFRVSVNVAQGERYVLHLLVDNRADSRTAQRFSLDEVPDPFSVDLFGDPPTGVDVGQVEHTNWLVNIEPEHPTTLPSPTSVPDDEQIIEVLVDVANTAVPKTYELSGALEPTSV